MNAQGSMFELGDAGADELVRVTDDGARVAEPTLWQDSRPMTSAELEAERQAAELLERHRRTLELETPAGYCVQCTEFAELGELGVCGPCFERTLELCNAPDIEREYQRLGGRIFARDARGRRRWRTRMRQYGPHADVLTNELEAELEEADYPGAGWSEWV